MLKKFFSDLYLSQRNYWNKKRAFSLLMALLFFAFAIYIDKIADTYVANLKAPVVGDLILNWLPIVNLNLFIIQGSLLMSLLVILLLIKKPNYVTFTIKALSLFIIVRAIFISLTHLGVSPHQLQLDTDSIGFGIYNVLFNTKGDFFFSAHTGLPFLMGLIFWDEKRWRLTFFIASFILGVSVLFAHIHYSIDVFAAPFVTYSIYRISQLLFPRNYKDLQLKNLEIKQS